jgi:Fic family protein
VVRRGTLLVPREYESSHPFITFELHLERGTSPGFWMLLGEARSKCDHIKYVPLAIDTARDLHLVYFAKGVNATTAIEGNTLSEEQVRERIEGQLELPISQEYLGTEIDNMIGAYNRITRSVQSGDRSPITIETLSQLNKEILAGLVVEEHVVPGELRQISVRAGNYVGAPWPDVPYLLDRLCEWLKEGEESETSAADRIPNAIIRAVTAHVYIEWIHPFGDGNGRLGRLVEFLILIRSGIPLPAAHVLTSHYNDTRTEYYRQLNRASQNGGDLHEFLQYAAQGLVDGLTSAIKRLHKQQEDLMWRALIDEAIPQRGEAPSRQRRLAYELAKTSDRWIGRTAIRALDPFFAVEYTGHPKMLTRDLNRLQTLGFIKSYGSGKDRLVRAAMERVRGMRPFVVSDGNNLLD